jgi:hypothetical protein
MHPKEFKEHWRLTYPELADLIGGYTVDGVQHWFRKENPVSPPQSLLNHLDNLHALFLAWDAQDNIMPPQQREIYEIARARRIEAERTGNLTKRARKRTKKID